MLHTWGGSSIVSGAGGLEFVCSWLPGALFIGEPVTGVEATGDCKGCGGNVSGRSRDGGSGCSRDGGSGCSRDGGSGCSKGCCGAFGIAGGSVQHRCEANVVSRVVKSVCEVVAVGKFWGSPFVWCVAKQAIMLICNTICLIKPAEYAGKPPKAISVQQEIKKQQLRLKVTSWTHGCSEGLKACSALACQK
jgi:hypothetical protein